MTTVYCARWILPISSAPLLDGAMAISGSEIKAVGARSDLQEQFPAAAVHDFGEAAILPGLINAHSHLELTAMRGFLDAEEGDFFAWLKKLTRTRAERLSMDDLYVSAAWGACEAARAGITCLGDASDAAGQSMRALRDVGLRGTVFQESFGPDPKLVERNLEELRVKIGTLRSSETELVRLGVSPHAPYTVSPAQLGQISRFAIAERLPLMMHAAESVAEDLLIRAGRGPFADGLAQRGIDWHAPGTSTVVYLHSLGLLDAAPLLAHCINVDDADIECLRQTGSSVAHCPKSNAKFGHGRAPLGKFLQSGVAVGLGSDSVASNNTCDILEEARFATLMGRSELSDKGAEGSFPGPDDALHLATLGGARALGYGEQIGELRIGKQADFVAIALTGTHQIPVYDPVSALVFASSARDVLMTVVAGKEIYRDGRILSVDEQQLRMRMNEIAIRIRS